MYIYKFKVTGTWQEKHESGKRWYKAVNLSSEYKFSSEELNLSNVLPSLKYNIAKFGIGRFDRRYDVRVKYSVVGPMKFDANGKMTTNIYDNGSLELHLRTSSENQDIME